MYYSLEEIQINNQQYQLGESNYRRILVHETSGLVALGSVVEEKPEYTLVRNQLQPDNKFLNRILNVDTTTPDISFPNRVPVVVNKFSRTDGDIEEDLVRAAMEHKSSLFVLGKNLDHNQKRRSTEMKDHYSIQEMIEGDIGIVLDMAPDFFQKEGESRDHTVQRILTNLSRGPHVVGLLNGVPIGVLGSVVNNGVACYFSGFVDEKHRSSYVLRDMIIELDGVLLGMDVDMVYSKSKNKALVLNAKRGAFGFNIWYADRTYERSNV